MTTDRIITVWRAESGQEPPEGTPAGVVAIEECTACGERRVTWAEDVTHGTDPWKKHFDYCGTDPEIPNGHLW